MIFRDILGLALNSHWKGSLLIPVLIPHLLKAILQGFGTHKASTGGVIRLLGLAHWEAC